MTKLIKNKNKKMIAVIRLSLNFTRLMFLSASHSLTICLYPFLLLVRPIKIIHNMKIRDARLDREAYS